MQNKKEKGGIALEYVLVSTFASVVAIALMGIAGKIFYEKLKALSEKTGVEIQEDTFDPFHWGSP